MHNIERVNGVDYVKIDNCYYKLVLCDTRTVIKAKNFEKKTIRNKEIRRMICFDFNAGMSKKDISIKYNKSTARINQILNKEDKELKEV